jgi:hypothetical protein
MVRAVLNLEDCPEPWSVGWQHCLKLGTWHQADPASQPKDKEEEEELSQSLTLKKIAGFSANRANRANSSITVKMDSQVNIIIY